MAAATIEGTESKGQPEEGGLPQLNPEHYASQIFWLAITFGLLFIVLSRVVLPKIAGGLQARKNRIEGDLNAAERSKKPSPRLRAFSQTSGTSRSRRPARARPDSPDYRADGPSKTRSSGWPRTQIGPTARSASSSSSYVE